MSHEIKFVIHIHWRNSTKKSDCLATNKNLGPLISLLPLLPSASLPFPALPSPNPFCPLLVKIYFNLVLYRCHLWSQPFLLNFKNALQSNLFPWCHWRLQCPDFFGAMLSPSEAAYSIVIAVFACAGKVHSFPGIWASLNIVKCEPLFLEQLSAFSTFCARGALICIQNNIALNFQCLALLL